MSCSRFRSWWCAPLNLLVVIAVIAGVLAASAARATPARRGPGAAPAAAAGAAVDPRKRDELLPGGWRSSPDRGWTTTGDATGFHVLVADATTGYAWRTAATLWEPGFDTDQWVGNACLTGSGRRAVVVYAPKWFTNRAELTSRGAFAAVVDLVAGTVRKLPVTASLAYFDPGCGAGEAAVLTQEGHEDLGRTRLVALDAATGRLVSTVTVKGQVTSAVPAGDGIVAAAGHAVVSVDRRGGVAPLARTANVAFGLHVDADGGVDYLDHVGTEVRVRRTTGTASATLATGLLGGVGLAGTAGGRVAITGTPRITGRLPTAVTRVDAPAGAGVSSRAGMVVRSVRPAGATPIPGRAAPVTIETTVTGTGKAVTFAVDPAARTGPGIASGRRAAPLANRASAQRVAGSADDPVDDDRWCSVARNDRRTMAYQPTPRQVEWAADMAVQDQLHQTRPADFKGFGLPAYSPQGWFPNIPLAGGGHVPPQILLGILAQESNLWQATFHALSGEFGNPLVGNFYGRLVYDDDPGNDWDIDWSKSDCGYGIAQVTDGMRMAGHEKPGEQALPPERQRAVALDYAADIAAGLRILETKWNEVAAAGMRVNDGNPSWIENWFFAVWAYNSGFHPDAGDGSPWGLGWLNNPVNPRYPADRLPFLEHTYADAAKPQRWPYPEKVLGWAGHPIGTLDGPGFRAAWWVNVDARELVKPPVTQFCDASNDCTPGAHFTPDAPDVRGEPAGPCGHKDAQGHYDLHCWYHRSSTWKEHCESICGHEVIRFDRGYPEQPDGRHHAPDCAAAGLPSNSVIVDDVPGGTPAHRCGGTSSTTGSFTLRFADDARGHYPSKINFHQLDGGYGGHLWFAQTTSSGNTRPDPFEVTGTWRPPASIVRGWTRIKVHVPVTGAWTRQATYTIDAGNGQRRHRVVNQAWQAHTWVDLGVFEVTGDPSVTLVSQTADGRGEDIAYDAVAFVPTSRPTVSYVALGDSYSAGEGVEPYDANSDFWRDGTKDACHRSAGAYARRVTLPGHAKPIAEEAADPAGTTQFAFLACAGGLTTSVAGEAVNVPPGPDDAAGHTDWGRPDRHWGEVAQVDTGYLDEHTTLVTITIGGNDARFGDILSGCWTPTAHCEAPGHVFTRRNGVRDPEPMRTYERHVIRDLLPVHLKAVYEAVRSRAPNAKIVVLGYPQLFPDDPQDSCVGGDVGVVTPLTQLYMNTLSDELTQSVATAVAETRGRWAADVGFIDPTPAWRDGGHWACGHRGTPWINGMEGPSSSGSSTPGGCQIPGAGGDADACEFPGVGSFHPTADGQRAYARLVNDYLARGT